MISQKMKLITIKAIFHVSSKKQELKALLDPEFSIITTLNANTDISTGSPPQYSDLYSHDKNKITVISKILQDKYQAFKTYQVHRIFPCAATVTFKQTNVKNVSVELDIK